MSSILWDTFKEIITEFIDNKPAIKQALVKPKQVTNIEENVTYGIPRCGIDLINSFEKCEFNAYKDQGGILTIAYGHTKDVKEGNICTQAQADAWRLEDCVWAWKVIQRNVKVPLTSNQGGALLSFIYNLGQTRFEEEGKGLLTMLNSGNYAGIPMKIKQFIWVRLPSGSLIISKGLVARRKAEANLFTGADWRQIS